MCYKSYSESKVKILGFGFFSKTVSFIKIKPRTEVVDLKILWKNGINVFFPKSYYS